MKSCIYVQFQLEDQIKEIKTFVPKKLKGPKGNQKSKVQGLKLKILYIISFN